MVDSDIACYIAGRMQEIMPQPEHGRFVTTKEIADCLQHILDQVCDNDFVYPTIAPDGEGGLQALWITSQYTVGITVFADGKSWVTLASPKERHSVERLNEVGVDKVRRRLDVLSKHVNEHNPAWRDLFRT